MARKLSTRRAKLEERQARKQIFIAFIVTAAIGLLFLFVLLPLILRFAISLARNENPFQTEVADTIPPQRPTIQPIPEDQQERDIEVVGYTEALATVSLIVDGEEAGKQAAGEDGQFTFSLTLDEGEYRYWLFAEDEAGNASALTPEYALNIDTTAPGLEILEPSDGQTFTLPREKTLEIVGKMSEQGRVYVNGSRNSTDEEGNFSTRVQLGEGENTITIYAEDAAGNQSDEREITVEYRP